MKQVNKAKAISPLPIYSRDIFFKKEMGKINASKDLFNNIRANNNLYAYLIKK